MTRRLVRSATVGSKGQSSITFMQMTSLNWKMPNRREFLGVSASALAAQTGKSAKPNIIIFYVDELRATALKLYDPNGIETRPG